MGLLTTSPLDHIAPAFLGRLPVGTAVYRLEQSGESPSLRLIYANATAEQITGLDADVEVGRLMTEITPGVTETDLLNRYAAVVETGQASDIGTITYADERVRGGTFQIKAVPLPDRCVGIVFEDVSDQAEIRDLRDAAAALAASEARSRTLFDAISDVLLVYPLGPEGPGPFVAFNQASLDLYGYTREELGHMGVSDLVVPGSIDIPDAVTELRRNRKASFRSTHVTKEGRQIPMATSARLVELDGQLCVVSVCRDDTERRAFERQLSRSNLGLERTVAQRTDQVEAFAEDLKILHSITTAEHADSAALFDAYLRAGVEMFGLPLGILSSTPVDPETGERMYRVEAAVSPDPSVAPGFTIPLRETFCDAVVAREETVTYADAAADPAGATNPACVGRGLRAFIGTPIWIGDELFGTLNFASDEPRDGGFTPFEPQLIEVMAEAIARRIRLDQAHQEQSDAQAWYQSVVETVGEGLLLVAADGTVRQSNPAAREMLGLEGAAAGHPARRPDWRVLAPDGSDVPPEALPEAVALRTHESSRGNVLGLARPDGTVRWYSTNATPVAHGAGSEVDTVVLTLTDVTELRATNEALSRLSTDTARLAHVGGWWWDVEADRMEWSAELYRILGLTENGRPPSLQTYLDLVPEDERERLQDTIEKAVRTGGAYAIEHTLVRPNGEVRQVVGRGEVVPGHGGRPTVLRGTAQDVTATVAAPDA